ncbi:MAG: LapA family protein [bacterium]|nr:LapA family protein [bacterium]
MTILFIVGLLLGAVAVIFSLQNIAVITVTFFSWHLTGSLALILSLAISTGVLITVLLILPESIKNYFRYKNLKKENIKLEEDLRKQKELTVFAKNIPPTEEAILKIEQGAIDSTLH